MKEASHHASVHVILAVADISSKLELSLKVLLEVQKWFNTTATKIPSRLISYSPINFFTGVVNSMHQPVLKFCTFGVLSNNCHHL